MRRVSAVSRYIAGLHAGRVPFADSIASSHVVPFGLGVGCSVGTVSSASKSAIDIDTGKALPSRAVRIIESEIIETVRRGR
jgi:hypothetical protein